MKHRDKADPSRNGTSSPPADLRPRERPSRTSKAEVTFPEDGAVLAASPDVVSMRFDTLMRITVISLTSETGGTFDLGRSDGMQPVTDFRATPPVLPDGRYTVDWRGLSPDGHPMKCRFSFEVAQ